MVRQKLYQKEALKEKLSVKQQAGEKVVFTNGCFDILHVGHLRYLAEARAKGDLLVVGLNSDSSVRKLKGEKRPIVPESERAEMLANLEVVDYVVIFNETTAKSLIATLKPDTYVKGGDYKIEQLPEAEVVKETKGASTTNLVKKIIKIYGEG